MTIASGTRLDGPSGAATLVVNERKGGGAFGDVFVATDSTTGRRYAVKVPRSSLLEGDEALAFRNDLMAAGRVKHANVVEVLWVSVDSTPPYIVMELAEGGTVKDELLRRKVAKQPLSPDEVRRWFDDVIDGIEAINALLLHRDIKPDNILISEGVLKITDFGLSKIVDAATRSQTVKEIGAMAYMAPEAWRGETNTIHRDMYAVGLTLFEIATFEYGLPIPSEPSTERWKETHLAANPKRLSAFRTDLSDAVEQVLLKLVAKRPADRYATWAEARAALTAAWAPAPPGTDAVQASRIVRAVTARRERSQAVESSSELAARHESELVQAATYSWNTLLQEFRGNLRHAADVGAIKLSVRNGDLVVASDNAFVAGVRQVWLRKEQKFNDGTCCKLVGVAKDARGFGFNAVLRRKPDDMYGTWYGYEWRRNFLFFAGKTVRDISEPFALEGADIETAGGPSAYSVWRP